MLSNPHNSAEGAVDVEDSLLQKDRSAEGAAEETLKSLTRRIWAVERRIAARHEATTTTTNGCDEKKAPPEAAVAHQAEAALASDAFAAPPMKPSERKSPLEAAFAARVQALAANASAASQMTSFKELFVPRYWMSHTQ